MGRTADEPSMNGPTGRAEPATRDQAPSVFAVILEDLIARSPGVRAAALVDFEGETVDYAGTLSPFSVRLAAAHLRIAEGQVAHELPPSHGTVQQVAVRASTASFAVCGLPEGYALVLLLARRALTVSERAIERARAALAREAGWLIEELAWHPVEVELERGASGAASLRLRVAGKWQEAAILGAIVRQRGLGYRVCLPSGAEITLIREPRGYWYADEPVGDPSSGF